MLLKREVEISAVDTRNCALHFFITSSSIISVKLGEDDYDLPFEELDKMSILVDLEGYESDENYFILLVYYEGEPISLAAKEYNLSPMDVRNKKETGTIFRDIFNKQKETFDKISNPIHQKYHRFFFDFRMHVSDVDYASNEEVSPEDKVLRSTAIAAINDLLFQRVLYRGFAYQTGKETEDDFLINTKANAYIEYLSEVYMGVFAEYFMTSNGEELNLEQIDEAYTKYYNGSLKLDNNYFSQPLSAYCFLFTEFAFLAVEMGVDQEFWGPLLPTLVKSQEIFSTVYKPEGKPPFLFSDYTINNFDRKKQYSKTELNSLNYQYSLKTFEDLVHEAGLQVFTAFTGNFVGEHTKYTESKIVKVVGRYIKKSIIGE